MKNKFLRFKKDNRDFGFFLSVFMPLIRPRKSDRRAPTELLAARLIGNRAKDLSPIELNRHKSFISIVLMIFPTLILGLLSDLSAANVLLFTAGIIIMAVFFTAYVLSGLNKNLALVIVIFMMILPVIWITVPQTGMSGLRLPFASLWFICAIVLSLFLTEKPYTKRVFYFFILVLFVSVFLETYFNTGFEYSQIFFFILNILFVGAALYTAMETYIVFSDDSYHEFKQATNQLITAQEAVTQNEKLASLGQLIAGVAHEINTPMGAIKAAGENLESSAHGMFEKMIGQNLDADALEALFTLGNICENCIKAMRSTYEERKSRVLVRNYFKDIEIKDGSRIADMLIRLEIGDLEKIETNIDIFTRPDILKLLDIMLAIRPYISSTQNILYSADRISKIMFALKSYAHTSYDSRYEPFDVVRSIENVLLIFYSQIKHGVEIVRDFEPGLPRVRGNEDELTQVWTNIIQNAVYAMTGVGRLTITVRREDNFITAGFRDTGCGMTPEVAGRMFDAFFTTKPLGEGTGIGLDICSKIINRHNGAIWAESEPGKGTLINIRLPLE